MRTFLAVLALACTIPLVFAQSPETRPGAKVILQLVSLSDSSFEKLIPDYPSLSATDGAGAKMVGLQTAAELHLFNSALTASRDVQILQTPILQIAGGRTGTFTSGESRSFTYDMQHKIVDGKVVGIPNTETVFLGHMAHISPTIAQDRKKLSLKIQYNLASLNSPPIPFAPRPPIDCTGMESIVELTASSGVVINLGKLQLDAESDLSPPMISKIPYLNRLFKNVPAQRESRHLLIVATASIVEIPLAKILVEDYRKALAEGRIEDAKVLGVKALAADPTCFAK